MASVAGQPGHNRHCPIGGHLTLAISLIIAPFTAGACRAVRDASPKTALLDVGRKANRAVSLKGITDTEGTGIHQLGTVFQPSRTRWRKIKLR